MMKMMKSWAILALVSLWAPTVIAQECAKDGVCDTHERCSNWKAEGECYRNKVKEANIDDDGMDRRRPYHIGYCRHRISLSFSIYVRRTWHCIVL